MFRKTRKDVNQRRGLETKIGVDSRGQSPLVVAKATCVCCVA